MAILPPLGGVPIVNVDATGRTDGRPTIQFFQYLQFLTAGATSTQSSADANAAAIAATQTWVALDDALNPDPRPWDPLVALELADAPEGRPADPLMAVVLSDAPETINPDQAVLRALALADWADIVPIMRVNLFGIAKPDGTTITVSNGILSATGTVTVLGNATTGSGSIVLATGPTLAGTVTLPDGATWASTGFADTATYTNPAGNIWNYGPTVSLSSTSSYSAQSNATIFEPTGASAANLNNMLMQAQLSTSSAPVTSLRGLVTQVALLAGYTGTAAQGINIALNIPVLSGSNPFTEWDGIWSGVSTNGNGITSGTVTNNDILLQMPSAAAASGGTVNNSALKITGNGGSGAGTTNNFAINCTSTAPSTFAGPVAHAAYSKQTPTTGFSITIGNLVETLILDPAGTLAAGTVTLPAAPQDGQIAEITSTQTITSLTVSPNSGQSVKNAPTTLVPSTSAPMGYRFKYVASNTTWYRCQ